MKVNNINYINIIKQFKTQTMKSIKICIILFFNAIFLIQSCVSEEERQRIAEEQHIQELMQELYNFKTGDSILLYFKNRRLLSETSYEIIKTYKSRFGIWEDSFTDLIRLGDSLSQKIDTIFTMQYSSSFAFDVPENTTWKDFRKTFSKKGYTLHQITDYTSPRFIKNPEFTGSGFSLMENPDYLKTIPNSIIKTDPKEYRKVDSETGFVYLYRNHFRQDLSGDIGRAEIDLDFFGDSLIALSYYIYETPNLHDIYVEKYGTPIYNRTEWSNLNGSDSIDLMIWEFRNMRVTYIGYLRTSPYNEMPHSVRVISEHKRRMKEAIEYAPKMAAKQKEDSDNKWAEYDAEQKMLKEERNVKQQKAFKVAI